MSDPLVSVIVPAYNAARFIERTLETVKRQTFQDWEAIIVDDGSADETADLAASFAADDRRFRVLQQSNGGVAKARNRGIAEARGTWLAPVDADDLWHPAKLERQLKALADRGPAAKIAYCWWAVIDERDLIIEYSDRFKFEGDVFRRMCMGNLLGSGSTALMDRAAVLEVGGYDASLQERGAFGCEDLALYIALAERHEFALAPEFLVGYRWVRGNMSSGAMRMLRSYDMALDPYNERFPEFAEEFRTGRYYLLDWLIGREKATGSVRQLVALLREMSRIAPLRAARLAATLPLSITRQRKRYENPKDISFSQLTELSG